jgi:hypothetical protein
MIQELRDIPLRQPQVRFGARIGGVAEPQVRAQAHEACRDRGAYLGRGVCPCGQVHESVEDHALRDTP